jgi:hypothetical protein
MDIITVFVGKYTKGKMECKKKVTSRPVLLIFILIYGKISCINDERGRIVGKSDPNKTRRGYRKQNGHHARRQASLYPISAYGYFNAGTSPV